LLSSPRAAVNSSTVSVNTRIVLLSSPRAAVNSSTVSVNTRIVLLSSPRAAVNFSTVSVNPRTRRNNNRDSSRSPSRARDICRIRSARSSKFCRIHCGARCVHSVNPRIFSRSSMTAAFNTRIPSWASRAAMFNVLNSFESMVCCFIDCTVSESELVFSYRSCVAASRIDRIHRSTAGGAKAIGEENRKIGVPGLLAEAMRVHFTPTVLTPF